MAMTLLHFQGRYMLWHYIQNKKCENLVCNMHTIERSELEIHNLFPWGYLSNKSFIVERCISFHALVLLEDHGACNIKNIVKGK